MWACRRGGNTSNLCVKFYYALFVTAAPAAKYKENALALLHAYLYIILYCPLVARGLILSLLKFTIIYIHI